MRGPPEPAFPGDQRRPPSAKREKGEAPSGAQGHVT